MNNPVTTLYIIEKFVLLIKWRNTPNHAEMAKGMGCQDMVRAEEEQGRERKGKAAERGTVQGGPSGRIFGLG